MLSAHRANLREDDMYTVDFVHQFSLTFYSPALVYFTQLCEFRILSVVMVCLINCYFEFASPAQSM